MAPPIPKLNDTAKLLTDSLSRNENRLRQANLGRIAVKIAAESRNRWPVEDAKEFAPAVNPAAIARV
jgi:hypothetical protein